jgi:membrane dipeptidase
MISNSRWKLLPDKIFTPAFALSFGLSLGLSFALAVPASSQADDSDIARKLHESLIVMDTHLDTPAQLVKPGFDIMARHDARLDYSQVDYPRMQDGGLDGGFWVIYSAQGALTVEGYQASRDTALLRALAIHKMTAAHPDTFELALLPEDAARITNEGKRIVYMSIENSYPLGEDISLLKTFFDLGVRMVGPVHFSNNQFADSSTDPSGQQWQGLSPLGRVLVKEANRLGIILDGSHAHDQAVIQMIELSKTPIILSHTGAEVIYDHPRNVSDAILTKLAETGGVIHMNAYGSYLKKLPDNPGRSKAVTDLRTAMKAAGTLTPAQTTAFMDQRRAIDVQYPAALASFEDYMEHFLHVLKLIGPDHVGVGADWDGGGGVDGMYDISEFPKITERLLAEGYTKDDLAKIWSGNVLRLLGQAQTYAEAQTQ